MEDEGPVRVKSDAGSEDRQRSEVTEERRDGGGEAGESGRRQDGRGVVVWTL